MTPGARVAAAAEVLAEFAARPRPIGDVLRDWGRAHRFAGSTDRAAIGDLVHDGLRARASLAHAMGDDGPLALALAAAVRGGASVEAVARASREDRHGAGPLSEAHLAGLERVGDAGALAQAPAHVRGDFPHWLAPHFARAFGEEAAAEGAALSLRAPVDLRVNTLKTSPEKAARALARFAPQPTPHSPVGLRIERRADDRRPPAVEADPAHGRGHFEPQDEASQLAALLVDAAPRMQVADICAGAGGKTLALAAQMANTGQIHAYDADPHRLRPIVERLARAGARNVQLLRAGDEAALHERLEGRMERVLVDAPCTGSGAWRRRADAKWRLSESALPRRLAEQRASLRLAAPLVKPGGRLVYATCSVLVEENEDQIAWFLEAHPRFAPLAADDVWRASLPTAPPEGVDVFARLSPRRHGTDGFFIAILEAR